MECVIQLGSQSHVHRLAEYATNPALQVFPRDPDGRPVCAEAQELGPRHSDHIGPCLLLLRHCLLSPAELAKTVESSFLRRYVHRVYWCNEEASTEGAAIGRAVSILEGLGASCPENNESLPRGNDLQTLQTGGPAPSSSHPSPPPLTAFPARQGEGAPPLQDEAGRLPPHPAPSCSGLASPEHQGAVLVRVQAFPRSSEGWVTQQIPEHIGLHPKLFTHTFNFVVAATACPPPNLRPSLQGPGSSSRGGAQPPSDGHSGSGSEGTQRACEGAAEAATGPAPERADRAPCGADNAGTGDAAERQQAQNLAQGRRWAGSWEKVVLFGVTPAEDMWRLPSDRAGLATGCASSAVCKLEEVLEVLAWRLDANSSVIDVGAAPGAWTVLLSQRAGRVLAIDPAPMSSAALARPNVTHVQRKVEDAAKQLSTWLLPESGNHSNQQGVPAAANGFHGEESRDGFHGEESRGNAESKDDADSSPQQHIGCDAVFCDANKHPTQSAHLVKPLLPFLKPGALIVITMKCRGRGRSKEALAAELAALLGSGIERPQCLWLLANSVFERTFVAFTT